MDFQAIYSEGAQPYFSTLWERLLDSVEEDVGTAQALKVVDFLYASGSLTDCPRPPGAVKRPQRSLVFHRRSFLYGAFVWARRGLNRPFGRVSARAVQTVCFGDFTGDDHVGVEDLLQLLSALWPRASLSCRFSRVRPHCRFSRVPAPLLSSPRAPFHPP